MISMKKINSIDYRKLDKDSYSSLKMFADDPAKYYKKFIKKERIREDKSVALILGDLVDTLLFSPEEYEMKFVEANTYELVKGKTHMGDFAIELWDLTEQCLSEDGQVTREFSELAQEAYTNVKFDSNGVVVKFVKKTFEQVVEDFIDSKEEEWYKLKRTGKTIITMYLKEKALRIIERLRTDDNTYEFFLENDEYEALDQMTLEFDLFGLPFKFMPDRVFSYKKNRKKLPYDLKCKWDILNFDYQYREEYLYLQAGCYVLGLKDKFPKDDVEPMKFLLADTNELLRPLIYECDEEDLKKSIEGFSVNGKKYKGIKEIVEDLIWARENNIWTISRTDFLNGGIRKLNINYD
jgi:hypothetical protein